MGAEHHDPAGWTGAGLDRGDVAPGMAGACPSELGGASIPERNEPGDEVISGRVEGVEKVWRVRKAARAATSSRSRVESTSSTSVATYLSGSVPDHFRSAAKGTDGDGALRLSGTGKSTAVAQPVSKSGKQKAHPL